MLRIFDQDIGPLVSYPSPIDFSEKINLLLSNDGMRQTFSQKARKRALSFTWDKTAQRIIHFFEALHEKRQLVSPNKLLNAFAPDIEVSNPKQNHLKYKSIVLSMNKHYQRSLNGRCPSIPSVLKKDFVITLLRNHTAREAEDTSC